MEAWKQAAWEAGSILLGKPVDSAELAVLVVVGAVMFMVMFNLVTKLVSLPVSSIAMAGATLLVLTAVCVGAGAAAIVYLSPLKWIRSANLRSWLPFAASLPGVLIVVTPSMRLTHRSRYGQSLVALLLGIGVLAATLVLTHAAYGAFKSGDQEFERTRHRTQNMNEFMNQ